MIIADIGSRGGPLKEWKLLKADIIDFEATEKVCLWKEKTRLPFYILKNEELSSLFYPNFELLKIFGQENNYMIKETKMLNTDTIDSLLAKADLLKIDVEGAAYEVLQGATKLLDKCVAVFVECEFIQKYKDQKLFPDVDTLLKNNGYRLCRIKTCRWRYSDSKIDCISHADCLYLKQIAGKEKELNNIFTIYKKL
jgi:hypothetical protein